MSETVRITEFGKARYETDVSGGVATVEDVLRQHGVEPKGRRVAVNGHPADPITPVLAGDEVTVTPPVQGG